MPIHLTEEQLELRDLVHDFAQREIAPIALEWDQKNEAPMEIVRKTRRELGISGLTIPEEYGGLGLGTLELTIMTEEMSRACLGITLCYGVTYLGILPILKGGTPEQKKKWLSPVAAGEVGVSFCLSEPGAGSDVPGMSTVAEKKKDKYILNGTKAWITGGGTSDAYTVFAYTNKDRGPRGVSCFYVERNTPGLSLGKKEDKLGIRASDTRQVIFEDCEVPAENLLGRENMGFVYALQTLASSRSLVAGMGVGIAQAALDHAVRYAKEREQFGQKISNFQAIQHMLADMAIRTETSRSITYRAARADDKGAKDATKLASISKAYTSNCAVMNALDAIQIHGGYGYTREYPVEKLLRDAKILEIFEGTTQIQKNEIATAIIKESLSA
ncbi:MAG: acyl-CoA dehydrogenase family protein [Spirochaetales bacterium]|nr:acyl-CoA dehydrogenase family protein [Spirochaetales bacterium]